MQSRLTLVPPLAPIMLSSAVIGEAAAPNELIATAGPIGGEPGDPGPPTLNSAPTPTIYATTAAASAVLSTRTRNFLRSCRRVVCAAVTRSGIRLRSGGGDDRDVSVGSSSL